MKASSKYFEAYLSSKDVKPLLSFDAKIIPFETLVVLVEFLESGQLNPEMDTLEQLLYATDYLKMDTATQILYDYLHAHLATQAPNKVSKATLLMYLRIFKIVNDFKNKHKLEPAFQDLSLGSDKTVHRCQVSLLFYLPIHFERVMLDRTVLNLDLDSLYDLLSCNVLNLYGKDVLRTIKAWVNHDFEGRKQHFSTLLECVYYSENVVVWF